MIRTIKLPEIGENFEEMYSQFYTRNESRYEMVILDKHNRAIEMSIDCKEEMAELMVPDKLYKFVIDVEKRFTNTEINSLMRAMHAHERSVGVKQKTEIARIHGERKLLYIQFSKRWSNNSVANSLYMTWFRLKISEILGRNTETDTDHLYSAEWLVNLVKAKGLGVLGRYRHKGYTTGMVRLSESMERGCFWWTRDEFRVGKRYFKPYITITKLFWEEFPILKEKWTQEQPRRNDY